MTMPGQVIFVYFKAAPVDDGRVAHRIQALQASLRARLGPGTVARFGHRHEEAPGQRTWLECYEPGPGIAPPDLLAVRRELAGAGLDALAATPAHVEVFEMRGEAPCA